MNEDIKELLHRESLVLASFKSRMVAMFIDAVFLSVIISFILLDKLSGMETYEEKIAVFLQYEIYIIAIEIIYHAFFTAVYGASIGKIAMKIQVMEVNTASKPSVLAAVNRSIVRIISSKLMFLGFAWALLDPSRQTWHDKTARTVVVNA